MSGEIRLVLKNNVTLAQEAAWKKARMLDGVKTVDDVDNVSMSRVSLFTTAPGAYQEYSRHLLDDYYDTNRDGAVSVTEFRQVEASNENLLTECTLKGLADMGFGTLSEDSLSAKFKANENKAQLFAENLDMNADGKIDETELMFFNQVADVLDGRKDGDICNVAEQALIEVITGLGQISPNDTRIKDNKKLRTMFTALGELHKSNPQYRTVINKYIQGATLSTSEKDLLSEFQTKTRTIMSEASQGYK